MLRNFFNRSKALTRRFSSVSDAGIEVLIEERFDKLYKDYAVKPENLEDYQKQLKWRAGNLGMLEMDLLVGKWAKKHLSEYDWEGTEKFERQVLRLETPDLYNLVMIEEKFLGDYELEDDHFVFTLREFAQTNWNSN